MSKLVKLYRMQKKCSQGIYACCEDGSIAERSFIDLPDMPEDDTYEIHPGPLRDKTLQAALKKDGRDMGDFFFAFKSIEVLRKWIPHTEWLQNLHSYGIVLAVYHCPIEDVIHGERQSLFASHVRKRQYSISTYFKLDSLCPSTASPTHSATRDDL